MTQAPTPGPLSVEITYEVYQDGDFCASSTRLQDAEHYARLYGQDGPVKCQTVVSVRHDDFLLPGDPRLAPTAPVEASGSGWEQVRAEIEKAFAEGITTQEIIALFRPQPSGETREAVLKGVGKVNGDGWKDTTTEGEIVFVWNAEKPAPYAPGQYPRVGNEGWSASTSQYDFTPATADDVPAIIALLSARPAPVASSDQPEQGALEVVAWPVVTDQWTETYCELTGRDPDGKQVTFVDGATVTTFRDMAKREIEAMLCAAPKAAVRAIAALTPPAEPVSRPAGEGEREALARLIRERIGRDFDGECHLTEGEAYRIIALLRPAAPGGGWQPIETAPKDGESILAICATAYSPVAGGTWWNEGWTHYSRPDEKWHGGVGRWFPTHWMPLPQAPAIPASEGGRG